MKKFLEVVIIGSVFALALTAKAGQPTLAASCFQMPGDYEVEFYSNSHPNEKLLVAKLYKNSQGETWQVDSFPVAVKELGGFHPRLAFYNPSKGFKLISSLERKMSWRGASYYRGAMEATVENGLIVGGDVLCDARAGFGRLSKL